MKPTATEVIAALQLQPHPIEGGYFRETWRSREQIPALALPEHGGLRSAGTAIYYLLTPATFSEMHLLPGDEVFHHYLGDPVRMLQLRPDGTGEYVMIGSNLLSGEHPQVVVPGGVWQGSKVEPGPFGFALLGATMAPGFDYADYRTGTRADLSGRWPAFADRIAQLTRS